MKEIQLTRGYVAIIDDEDYERVSAHCWHAFVVGPLVYARRGICVDGKRTTQLLHQFLLGSKPGHVIDHRDGDGLNDRRSNLRFVTHQQNLQARHRSSANSRIVGVTFVPNRGEWRAYIHVPRTSTKKAQTRHLGYFPSRELAAEARRISARAAHGEYSCA